MWLHPLQSPNINSQPIEVDGPLLRQDMSLNPTPRPEFMKHPSPRLLRICSKIAGPILANLESRCDLREFEIHDGLLVDRGLDCVALPILAEIHTAPVRLETLFVF